MTTVWINTFICVLGFAGGLVLAMGSVMSIANMQQLSWAGVLLVMAFGVPVSFVISGIGTWWAYSADATQLVMYLVALPWVYVAIFISAMLLAFKLQS